MAAYPNSSSRHILISRQIRSHLPKPAFSISPPISTHNRSVAISHPRFSSRTLIRQTHILQARSSMADKVERQYKGNGKSSSTIFPTEEELSVSLAKCVADFSQKFTTERGAFTVVVCGGSLIKSLYTGIVEEMGEVKQIGHGKDGGFDLRMRTKTVLEDVKLGDSIAVNSTCLTVTEFNLDSSEFMVGLASETLRKTSLVELKSGSLINLERALLTSTRMGGHFVQVRVFYFVIL